MGDDGRLKSKSQTDCEGSEWPPVCWVLSPLTARSVAAQLPSGSRPIWRDLQGSLGGE